MIVLGGVGNLIGARTFPLDTLVLPTREREIAEQWVFGRSDREDLLSAADAAAGEGIRHSAAERQAALERLFGELIVAQHQAALDDARTQVPDVETISEECQAAMLVVQDKVERLRFPDQQIVVDEMRAYIRAFVEQTLAGPASQWRNLLRDKFNEVGEEAHDVPLNDVLRDVGETHAECQVVMTIARLAVAAERFN